MILGELTIYSLLYASRWRLPEAYPLLGLAIPLLLWHSAVQSTDIASLHIYPWICSVAPCLRVLWMSTHGCFAPSFPPFYTRLLRPDIGAQEPDATVDDDSYYTGGAYCYVQPADDDQE